MGAVILGVSFLESLGSEELILWTCSILGPCADLDCFAPKIKMVNIPEALNLTAVGQSIIDNFSCYSDKLFSFLWSSCGCTIIWNRDHLSRGTVRDKQPRVGILIYIWQRLTAVGTRCADHVTPFYPQKLVLTSPTGGGRSVGIVRSRTKATEFSLV